MIRVSELFQLIDSRARFIGAGFSEETTIDSKRQSIAYCTIVSDFLMCFCKNNIVQYGDMLIS